MDLTIQSSIQVDARRDSLKEMDILNDDVGNVFFYTETYFRVEFDENNKNKNHQLIEPQIIVQEQSRNFDKAL
jgi:hypothetical protein